MKKSLWFVPILIALSTLLIGCFEIEEKVTLTPDGAGIIRFLVRLPIAAKPEATGEDDTKTAMEKLSQELGGFTSVDVQTLPSMGQTAIAIEAKAPKLSSLAPFYNPVSKNMKGKESGQGAELGEVLVSKNFYALKKKGDHIVITRTFLPPKKKKKQKEEDKNLSALMGFMGSSFIRFELEVPGTVVSSNAESVDGSRLTWVVPLSYFQDHKVVLQAEVKAAPDVITALVGK